MEIWKDIKGYEGFYQISSLGRVKSLDRIIHYNGHNIADKHRHKGKEIAKIISHKGYAFVQLWKNNKKKRHFIHQLIARHFIENPDNLYCINHIDGEKSNNSIRNLEWTTLSENSKHAWRLGLVNGDHSAGEKNYFAKLSTETVVLIKKAIASKRHTVKEVMRMFGICRTTYFNIKSKKQWASVKI